MSQALVRQAFEQRLSAWAAAKLPTAIPVAWDNVLFSPLPSLFAAATLLPAQTGSDTLDGLHRRYSGVFQVTLYLPIGTGAADGEALLSEIDALFPVSAPIVVSDVSVWLLTPMGAAPPLPTSDHYVVPVSGTYRADTVPL